MLLRPFVKLDESLDKQLNIGESASANRYIVQPPLTFHVDDSQVRSADKIQNLYYVTRLYQYDHLKDPFHFGLMSQWVAMENSKMEKCQLVFANK